MGNCLSKRRRPNLPRTEPIISTSLDAISTPLAVSTAPAQQILSTPPQTEVPVPPTEFSVGNRSMFTNAQHTHISGGSFNITTTGEGPSLDILYGRVASNAILNAGGRADEVRCHPGTREEVINRIEKWGDALDDLAAPMFWLSGPAGAGKSAIMQTIAERCEERGVPHANFFFFRADTSRSNAPPLIPTLVYQIIDLYPSLREPMAALLAADPLIFNRPLENQLAKLIVAPLNSLSQVSLTYRPLIILIDGLDECDSESKQSQRQILYAFDKVLLQHTLSCPFRLLVASRNESLIQLAFNGISSQCMHLYLDEQYSPEVDIQVFVNAKFEEVRKQHPLSSSLPANWPLPEDIIYIVEKSSGQFIYAATVMRFILDSSASPKLSLERVKGAAQVVRKSPFSYLDAIYTYILTQVEDQEAAKDILCAQLFITRMDTLCDQVLYNVESLADGLPLLGLLGLYNFRYTEDVILSCFADLTPIVQYQSEQSQLLFHHASFSDYLSDQFRSEDYSVDVTAFSCKISPIIWDGIQSGRLTEAFWKHVGILTLLELPKFPPGLMNNVASPHCNQWTHIQLYPKLPIFNIIHEKCITNNDVNNFRQIFYKWLNTRDTHLVALDTVKHIPFAHRYFYMVYAKDLLKAPDANMRTALCPTSDFDCHESNIWLNDLLHRVHQKIYPSDPEQYNQLLKAWISWAYENNIPCHGLEDLPDIWNYIQSGAQG